MSEPVIEVRDLSFSYSKTRGIRALSDINWTVNQGDYVGLIGPNGSGKSTLIRLVLGLLEPQVGEVRVLGCSPKLAAPEVGFVPQQVQFNRDFPITVWRGVEMAGLRSGKSKSEISKLTELAIEETGLSRLTERRLSELSGGELQRFLISRALVVQPKILILDEPTASIDPAGEQSVFDLLKEINRDATIVIVSHDVGFVSHHVQRVACLNQTLVMHETPHLSQKMLDELYGVHVHAVHHRHGGKHE